MYGRQATECTVGRPGVAAVQQQQVGAQACDGIKPLSWLHWSQCIVCRTLLLAIRSVNNVPDIKSHEGWELVAQGLTAGYSCRV